MPFDNPNLNQQAMMAEALRQKAPEQDAESEGLPEGCCCGQCPIAEQCMAAGGGPKTPEDVGAEDEARRAARNSGMGGMGGGMKMGGAA